MFLKKKRKKKKVNNGTISLKNGEDRNKKQENVCHFGSSV